MCIRLLWKFMRSSSVIVQCACGLDFVVVINVDINVNVIISSFIKNGYGNERMNE